jgi:hypothetical protein
MKYLQSFNERLGLNLDIDKQVEKFYKEIVNSQEKEFNFVYENDKGRFPFKVIIGGGLKGSNWGTYNFNIESGSKTIKIKSRGDYATLLHEVKHLDYSTRNKEYWRDIFKWGELKLSKIGSYDPLNSITNVFYLYNDNEFQSKYHSYYIDFDNFIAKNISDNPTPTEIWSLFERFLMSNRDNSWSWYFKDEKFKFEDYLSKSQINRLFTQFIYNNDIYNDEYNSLIKWISTSIRRLFKTKLNKYSEKELKDIDKVKRFYEKQINLRLPKYRRRFLRIVQLMVDKWC